MQGLFVHKSQIQVGAWIRAKSRYDTFGTVKGIKESEEGKIYFIERHDGLKYEVSEDDISTHYPPELNF